jgi:predicted amidohydrolase YtcJ
MVGKLAYVTMLGEDLYDVGPKRLNRISVQGTVFEGRWFPGG